jgi:hypothetical protein
MLETVVLAVTLGLTIVVSNLIVSLVTMRLFTSPKFLKSYTKKLKETCEEIVKEVM